MRRDLITVGVLPPAAIVVGCGQFESPFPPPLRLIPISGEVLLSPNGRVITAWGVKACGRRPLLIVGSYRHRVTLMWRNPDTNCNAEFRTIVSTSLSAPLGGRALVQASDGMRIAYRRAASNSPVTPVLGTYMVISGRAYSTRL